MYFYPWGTHISWSTSSALLLTPYMVGRFHQRTPFFTENPVIFITCNPKIPFCIKTPRIFILGLHLAKKTNKNKKKNIFTENTLIFVTKRSFLVVINFVTERPMFKSCATGISPHPLPPSWTSVSPTDVLPWHFSLTLIGLSCRVNDWAVGLRASRLHAKPSASTIRNYIAHTHNARLKSRYKCTHPDSNRLAKTLVTAGFLPFSRK